MGRKAGGKASSGKPDKYKAAVTAPPVGLPKSPSGIRGLDEITGGGLPTGRPTLICGGAGAGKTLMAMEFLVRGAAEYGEPGVFMAFEETGEELAANVASLGFDLNALIEQRVLGVDYVRIERSEIEETGEYDLEGLFVRLGYAIDQIGAKRVVLDTLESLFSGFPNELTLRAELRRLFRWLKERGMTAVITAERGKETMTRYGIEEYVSDCVILLDHRVTEQIATRRLRIAKYRGTSHGTNEYPFLIDDNGVSVVPITSLNLDYDVSVERVSTGVESLDAMLEGLGYFRGSSVLISGLAGTGKTSFAASCVNAACAAGKRCLYMAFEQSFSQIVRDMGSIGMDMGKWAREGLLQVHASRPSFFGLEMHLVAVHRLVRESDPEVVVVDSMSNLGDIGGNPEIRSMLMRLVDFLKMRATTAIFTSLGSTQAEERDRSVVSVSSLMDTWIELRYSDEGDRRRRALSIIKSRGMAHSNRIMEFQITADGLKILHANEQLQA